MKVCLSNGKVNSTASLGTIIQVRKINKIGKPASGKEDWSVSQEAQELVLRSDFEQVIELLFVSVSFHTCKMRNKPNQPHRYDPTSKFSNLRNPWTLTFYDHVRDNIFTVLRTPAFYQNSYQFPQPLTLSVYVELFSQWLSLLEIK